MSKFPGFEGIGVVVGIKEHRLLLRCELSHGSAARRILAGLGIAQSAHDEEGLFYAGGDDDIERAFGEDELMAHRMVDFRSPYLGR